MSAPVAEMRDVHRTYARGTAPVHALRGVSLAIAPGEYVAVLGPSGSGKSTLLNLLAGIDLPTSGSLHLLGRDTRALSDRERTRLRLNHIGFVFQRFHLLPALSAAENVELPMAEARVPAAERRRRARELLETVGLAARADHTPGELSGGEMQRVAIARALANRPSLILGDEPTGELDQGTGAAVAELLGRVNAEGTALVLVTHDPVLAQSASRVVHIRDGRIVETVDRRDRSAGAGTA